MVTYSFHATFLTFLLLLLIWQGSFSDEILEQLKEGRKTRSYSENVRSFALTLNFYSNAAYQYIRRKFGNHLPALSTLRSWYSNIDGDPGIYANSIDMLKKRGAEVMSLTFDGAPNNFSMATALGADFSNPTLQKEYSFKNPATGQPIFIILDICHMIKLVRNILGLKWILYDKGLNLGIKLTQQHVMFHSSKMKVKLAAQTLSNSVADVLSQILSISKLSRIHWFSSNFWPNLRCNE